MLFVLFLLLIARDSAGERAENSRNSMNSKVPGGARQSGTRGHAPAGIVLGASRRRPLAFADLLQCR